jgi:hypothetical protein
MRHFLIAFAALSLLSGCNVSADTDAAEQAVIEFHRAMDSGQYAAIYDASAEDMKSSISRDDFIKLLDGLHGKFGPFQSGKTTGWHDNSTTGGHYVSLSREAQFQKGQGTEDFVFRIEKGRVVLAGYHINSNLLVTG